MPQLGALALTAKKNHQKLNPRAPPFHPANKMTLAHTRHKDFFSIGHLNVNRLCFKMDQIKNLVHNLNLCLLAVSKT